MSPTPPLLVPGARSRSYSPCQLSRPYSQLPGQAGTAELAAAFLLGLQSELCPPGPAELGAGREPPPWPTFAGGLTGFPEPSSPQGWRVPTCPSHSQPDPHPQPPPYPPRHA